VNAYEGKAGMVYLQVKLRSMPERFQIYIVYKRRYINTFPFLSFPFFPRMMNYTVATAYYWPDELAAVF